MQEAMLYEQLSDERVRCNLCGHHCVISQGKPGVCLVRYNRKGKLYTQVYGRTVSQQIDPIEKKPLYHFYPGSLAYSIATPGCNFQCPWCQNWDIAHMPRQGDLILGNEATPEQLAATAQSTGCRSIAYTYSEPTIFFEYAYQTARRARELQVSNIYVTNGYMTTAMLETFQPYLDAANVDLKAFRKKTYHRYAKGGLQTVLDSMRTMKKLGIWLEVTTLVIPGLNDDPLEMQDIAQFIAQELDVETPWHLSRFFPSYKMSDRPATPIETLRTAQEIGQDAGLKYVYLGNVAGESNTHCPNCRHLLIRRKGYWITENNIQDGNCPECGTAIAGVWG
ncbi:MAG: AmmeMemoRadiSam system radical SAM enzyme [Chloroflexi bacterium]|nr:AmmeMemoRadiSam system radical SAM enzyme [Chloroflexota bacterium]